MLSQIPGPGDPPGPGSQVCLATNSRDGPTPPESHRYAEPLEATALPRAGPRLCADPRGRLGSLPDSQNLDDPGDTRMAWVAQKCRL